MIIGIAGPKRSGKTTLANALCETYRIAHLSFAAPIRDFIASLVGCSLAELERVKEKPVAWLDGITPRQMMQTLGTEWGRRMVHSELWVRRVMYQATHGGGAVISDVRFPNEAEAIRGRGGVVIRLHRAGYGDAANDSHESEAPLANNLVDFEIVNDGTPERMAVRAALCVQHHFRLCQNTTRSA
jgi:hypothetical protein